MVLHQKRRARILAVALIVSLLVPIAVASTDYWRGKRTNGAPSGGFYITPSAQVTIRGADIGNLFRSGAQKWRGASIPNAASVATNMIEHFEWVPGSDKYYVEDAYRLKGQEDLNAQAVTRIYGNTPKPGLRNLDIGFPDSVKGQNKHGNGCGHDRDWDIAVVILFDKGANKAAQDFNRPFALLAESAILHELGHTLKIAH